MSVRLGENSDFESFASGTGTAHTYTYDLAGRRTAVGGSYARTNVPPAAPTASYNLNNQLTNWNGATLAYDNNGNLTNDGTNTYMWNARNQLVDLPPGSAGWIIRHSHPVSGVPSSGVARSAEPEEGRSCRA